MQNWLKISISSLIIAILVFASVVGWFFYSINHQTLLSSPISLKINKGEGVRSIASKLVDAKLINSSRSFESYVYWYSLGSKLKSGDYLIKGSVSVVTLASTLIKGETTSNTKKITFPEGWTTKEMDKYLADNSIIEPGQYIRTANDANYLASIKPSYDFFNDVPAGAGLEGFLFPDTYSIYANSTVGDIFQKQLQNFNLKFKTEWREAAYKQGKTIFQVVTLASIIEKEVRKPEDMKLVSGIFWNRLKAKQALQSCATLAYVLGVNKSQYSIADTKTNSPYNTYLYKGLPPGPIANPGANAIEAAIFPTQTDYQFFLTADLTGQTIFSKTYNEHLSNKAKYLK
jgi:UPF0755 protein